MPATYVTTNSKDFVNPPQYIEETTVGTIPTSSPTLLEIGKIRSFSITHDTLNKKFRVLGSEDLFSSVKTGEAYAIQLEFGMLDSTFFKYLSQAKGGGAGTIDKTFSLFWSKKVDGTTYFENATGCRINSGSISVTPDEVKCSLSIIALGITVPNATNPLTTPTLVTTGSSSDPWTGLDSGSNPLTHNSNNYDVPNFNMSINRNLDIIRVNGSTRIIDNPSTKRDVSGTFDVIKKDAVLKADAKALTSRTMSYVLKSATSTISFTGARLEKLDESFDAEAGNENTESFGYFAKTVSVS